MLTTYQQQAKLKLAAAVVALVVIAGVMTVVDHIKPRHISVSTALTGQASNSSATTPASTPSTSSSSPSTPTTNTATGSNGSSSSGYKDGTYSATATYYVPHSNESIKVDLILSNGTITDVSIQNSEGDPTSAAYQESFASSYKSAVIGQKISTLQLSVIGGASDTTQGFADALSQISSQAKA